MGESTAWSPHPAKDKNKFPEQIQTAAPAPFHPRHCLGTDSPRDCAQGPFHQVRKTWCSSGHTEPAASCRVGSSAAWGGSRGGQGLSPGPSAFLSLVCASVCPCCLFSFLVCPRVFVLPVCFLVCPSPGHYGSLPHGLSLAGPPPPISASPAHLLPSLPPSVDQLSHLC